MKCGIDIINNNRIRMLVDRRGTGYLSKIWTANEVGYCTRTDGTLQYESLAARYAAKEAVGKAFGTGLLRSGIRLEEIEILNDRHGAPYVVLHGATKDFYIQQEFQGIEISLSHDGDNSVAMCILTEKCKENKH